MKSSVSNILPQQVQRSLTKFGLDLSIARRKRRLTVAMMCERVGISRSTWQRMEKGDATVSLGAYVQALFVLGLGTPLTDIVDPGNDELGLLLEIEHLPKRVTAPKAANSDKKNSSLHAYSYKGTK